MPVKIRLKFIILSVILLSSTSLANRNHNFLFFIIHFLYKSEVNPKIIQNAPRSLNIIFNQKLAIYNLIRLELLQ
jgi:hypothetical protein